MNSETLSRSWMFCQKNRRPIISPRTSEEALAANVASASPAYLGPLGHPKGQVRGHPMQTVPAGNSPSGLGTNTLCLSANRRAIPRARDNLGGQRDKVLNSLSLFPVTTGMCGYRSPEIPDLGCQPSPQEDRTHLCRLVCPSLTGTGVSVMLTTTSYHAPDLQVPDSSGWCCLLRKATACTKSSGQPGGQGERLHRADLAPGDNPQITLPPGEHYDYTCVSASSLSWTLAGLCPVQPCETLLPVQDRIIPRSRYVKLCLSQGQEPACQATVDMAYWSHVTCMSRHTRV